MGAVAYLSGRTLAVILLLVLFYPYVALAQTEPLTEVLDEESDGRATLAAASRPIRINRFNWTKFEALIPRELHALLRSGELEFEATKNLEFEWKYDDQWIQNSSDIDGDERSEAEGLELRRGFPYPEVFKMGETEALPADLVPKLLWNGLANYWGGGYLRTHFRLFRVVGERMEWEYQGSLERAFPTRIGAPIGGQLFRERVQLTAPEPLSGFVWLTYRFIGDNEDALWMYSPAIDSIRRLVGSMRGDSLIPVVIALDDIFTWSGKVEALQADSVSAIEALVPYPSLRLAESAEVSSGCLTVQDRFSLSDSAFGRWNFQVRRYSGGAWLPTELMYVPRKAWRIALGQKDPYALPGRQVVYVEKDSNLPWLRVVYDQAGVRWKTIWSAFGLALSPDRLRRFAYPSVTVVYDHKAKEAALIDYAGYTMCEKIDPEPLLSRFAPSSLKESAKAEAEESSSSASEGEGGVVEGRG